MIESSSVHEYDDCFGKKGHALQTFQIILGTIFFWILVLFPFAFVGLSLFDKKSRTIVWSAISSIGLFFLLWVIVLGILSLVLTILNNWKISRQAHCKITYNKKGVEQKELI